MFFKSLFGRITKDNGIKGAKWIGHFDKYEVWARLIYKPSQPPYKRINPPRAIVYLVYHGRISKVIRGYKAFGLLSAISEEKDSEPTTT